MSKKATLERFEVLLNTQGQYCDYGCSEENVRQMITYAKKLFPNKPYCVVAQWCWADVDLKGDSSLAEGMRHRDILPCFIYATQILHDEANRWSMNTPVRTSLLVSFHHHCIFVTRNTSYILLGLGVRLKVAPSAFVNLPFY